MAGETNPSTGEVSLVYMIGRLNQGLRKDMRRVLADCGLSVPEFTALSILRRRPGLSNAQLARRTMVTPQAMIEILAGLESRELVHRTVDPNHGRVLKSELTPEGRRLVTAARPKIDRIQDRLLTGVSSEEREIVIRVMLKAMQHLQNGEVTKSS